MPELELGSGGRGLLIVEGLKAAGLVSTTSEGVRSIQQGAVKVDGERVEDRQLHILAGATHVFQVGKRRFARITIV
jgi:tyrosyl-tRNA synthetase